MFRAEERYEGLVVYPDLEGKTDEIVGKVLTGPGESQGLFQFEHSVVPLVS